MCLGWDWFCCLVLDGLFNSVGVVVYTGVYVFVCCCDLFDLFNGCFEVLVV